METAWDFHKVFPEADFCVVKDAGHSAFEVGIAAELVAKTNAFKEKKAWSCCDHLYEAHATSTRENARIEIQQQKTLKGKKKQTKQTNNICFVERLMASLYSVAYTTLR